jgi:GNAT superfamily N-acetyltransferase
VDFRRDTHIVSYGTATSFSRDDAEKYFYHIANKSGYVFQHIFNDQEIIGQLEFDPCVKADGGDRGYINLFFLKKDYRGLGIGKIIHAYVIENIFRAGCQVAELRVIPGNIAAEKFYAKNGWIAVGAPTERGQLMRLTF